VVARWEKELDHARMDVVLKGGPPDAPAAEAA
jgi:hypothetical protein